MPERLDQPRDDRRGPRFRYDAEAFGKLTEKVARFLGTGRYLVVQSVIIIVWLVENFIPGIYHFDQYPLGFLTLILSLQASYAAPLILLAQNRQDDRDRVNLDADRDEASQAKADLEYLARELAAIRMALGEVATRDFLRSELSRLEDDNEREAREAREKARRKARAAKAEVKEARAEVRELQQVLESQSDSDVATDAASSDAGNSRKPK